MQCLIDGDILRYELGFSSEAKEKNPDWDV